MTYCANIINFTNLFKINTLDKKYILSRLNSYEEDTILLFKSNILHRGKSLLFF